MKAGFSHREITPSRAMPMAGFDRRISPSTGTLDPLYVSVLALNDNSETPFLFCSFDLLGVDSAFCAQVKNRLAERFTLAEVRIWVSSTHTHSAPSCHFSTSSWYDPDYISFLLEKTTEAAAQAIATWQEAIVSCTMTHATGVASLRNQGREGAAYPMPLLLVTFKRPNDSITLCRIACHPTILDEKNTLYSRDLPGAAHAGLGKGTQILFFNGACADLSTRFTRSASSPEELNRLGRIISEQISADDSFAAGQSDFAIRASAQTISLSRSGSIEGPQKEALLAALREKAAACTDPQAWREYDSRIAVLERQSVAAEAARLISISAVDLGEVIFLSLPFEVDSADGAEIEQMLTEVAGKPVYLFCYTGGYDGYLPSGLPLSPDSSYEDIASRYPPEARKQVWESTKQCVLQIIQ